jgi:hypothetical protein
MKIAVNAFPMEENITAFASANMFLVLQRRQRIPAQLFAHRRTHADIEARTVTARLVRLDHRKLRASDLPEVFRQLGERVTIHR